MRRRLASCVVVLTALGSAAGLLPAQASSHKIVTCGTTLTESTVLANGLRNCPFHGLVVSGTGITIDLNGNTITGDAADVGGFTEVGILCRNDCRGVRIKNGTVRSFELGVATGSGSDRVTIAGVTAIQNELDGFSILSPRTKLVRNYSASNGGSGFAISSNFNLLSSNSAHENAADGFVVDSVGTEVSSNSASENVGSGIYVAGEANVVEGNLAADNVEDGLSIDGLDGLVSSNAAMRNEFGFTVSGARQSLKGNLAQDNAEDGYLILGNDHRFRRDRAIANREMGFHLRGSRVAISRAVSRSNGFHGFFVFAKDSIIRESAAFSNGADGIFIHGSESPTVIRNVANRNGFTNGETEPGDDLGMGIRVDGVSVSGLIARKNVAKGNDDPLQCSVDAACN